MMVDGNKFERRPSTASPPRQSASPSAPRSHGLDIARIVKVNHAGEYGAIRIYRAQIWVARRLYPDLLDFLRETLRHEEAHCAIFQDAMPSRHARSCRIMSLWGTGGYLLGFLTALTGRRGIWICTAAVESTVHRHLDDQLHFLSDKDPQLHDAIEEIQREELQHLSHAVERLGRKTPVSNIMSRVISSLTDAVIWLSTQGASARMSRDLRAARAKPEA